MSTKQDEDPPLDILSSVESPTNNPWTFHFTPVSSSSTFASSSSPLIPDSSLDAAFSYQGQDLPSQPSKELQQRTFIFSGDYWPQNSVRIPHRHHAKISPEALIEHAFEPPANGFDFEDRIGAPYYAKSLYEHVVGTDSSSASPTSSAGGASRPFPMNSTDGMSLETSAPLHTHSGSHSDVGGWRGLFGAAHPLVTTSPFPAGNITSPGSVQGSYFPYVPPNPRSPPPLSLDTRSSQNKRGKGVVRGAAGSAVIGSRPLTPGGGHLGGPTISSSIETGYGSDSSTRTVANDSSTQTSSTAASPRLTHDPNARKPFARPAQRLRGATRSQSDPSVGVLVKPVVANPRKLVTNVSSDNAHPHGRHTHPGSGTPDGSIRSSQESAAVRSTSLHAFSSKRRLSQTLGICDDGGSDEQRDWESPTYHEEEGESYGKIQNGPGSGSDETLRITPPKGSSQSPPSRPSSALQPRGFSYPPPGTFHSSHCKLLRSEQAAAQRESAAMERRHTSPSGSVTYSAPQDLREVSSGPGPSPMADEAEPLVLSISEFDVFGAEAFKRGTDWYTSGTSRPRTIA